MRIETGEIGLSGRYVGYGQFGPAAERGPAPEREGYWFLLPALRGAAEPHNSGYAVCSGGRNGRLNLMLRRRERMQRHPAPAVDAADFGRRLYAAVSDLEQGRTELWTRNGWIPDLDIGSFFDSLDHGELLGAVRRGESSAWVLLYIERWLKRAPETADPAGMQWFEQRALTSLISLLRADAGKLHRPAKIVSGDVRRATAFIGAHLGSAIGLRDIVAAAGAAERTLLAHFRKYTGLSPLAYLRRARFAGARDALLRAGEGDSVTAIAMRFGFAHLGRFSLDYCERFGESPSATLARSRAALRRARGTR